MQAAGQRSAGLMSRASETEQIMPATGVERLDGQAGSGLHVAGDAHLVAEARAKSRAKMILHETAAERAVGHNTCLY